MLKVAGFESRSVWEFFELEGFSISMGVEYDCACHTIVSVWVWYRHGGACRALS